MNLTTRAALSVCLLAVIVTGCGGNGPGTMHYGDDRCDYCKMLVADPAFGSQLVSSTGKVFKFDSIECLTAYELVHENEVGEVTRWLADINNPGSFLRGDQAIVVRGERLRSPMGLGLAAVASDQKARDLSAETNGASISWSEVREYVSDAWDVR